MGLNPNYAAVSGRQQVTGRWAITLPGEFNRREEEAGLCFWRPGLTIWLSAYGAEDGMTIEHRLGRDRGNASPQATDITESLDDGVGRLTYCLSETRADGAIVNGLYSYAHGVEGQVMVAAYFDGDADLETARKVSGSITYTG
jgi:hypothetical protein